ncbi:hypothetical protein EYY85_21685 [Hafnia paralvei]|nr:hypothetical protein EYY85_21685 [Hafnia paralvei]
MAIAVRSVKAEMTSFGHLRSRLKNGAKLGCRGAAIGPPTRTTARSACQFRYIRRTKFTLNSHIRRPERHSDYTLISTPPTLIDFDATVVAITASSWFSDMLNTPDVA